MSGMGGGAWITFVGVDGVRRMHLRSALLGILPHMRPPTLQPVPPVGRCRREPEQGGREEE